MRSNFAQTTLASVLAVVTVVLLVAAGFLARVVMEGDTGPVQRIATPEVTETADPATPAAADAAPDQRIGSAHPGLLEEMVEQLEDGGGIGAIILDVRGNPGGLLRQTAETADLFFDTGTIVVQVDRAGSEWVYRADRGTVTDLPIAIVQDEFSASGSEVLAAAIQENGRGIVVGATSFGKGTVNRAHSLSNGGAVYVSTARWLTPDRNLIEGRGVIPDIEVTLAAGDVEAARDLAVLRAIDALRARQGGAA